FLPRTLEGSVIAIFTDGACLDNEMPWARVGLGVYFGPNSPYNLSEQFSGSQTSQRAEIRAAVRALEKIEDILHVEGQFPGRNIVIITDSQYVVGAMTGWLDNWRGNGWRTSGGHPVANLQDFIELEIVVERLEQQFDLAVRFWHVPREYNTRADALAKAATSGGPSSAIRTQQQVMESLGLYLA
ncbi:Ribonuclease H1, partial [Leucoagaricus sp. SymC.cos]